MNHSPQHHHRNKAGCLHSHIKARQHAAVPDGGRQRTCVAHNLAPCPKEMEARIKLVDQSYQGVDLYNGRLRVLQQYPGAVLGDDVGACAEPGARVTGC